MPKCLRRAHPTGEDKNASNSSRRRACACGNTLPLKSEIDTLRAYRIAGGAGTYSTRGTSYTEHLDYFFDPSWVGTSFRAICRIEGDRWYHSYTFAATMITLR